jgi:lipopolysaccharide export system permease protein
MKVIRKYLAFTVLKAMSLVVILLAAISGIIELLREITVVGTGQYTLTAAFWYVLTTIPQHLYEFFPMAGLLGCMLGLGMLASRSEIIAMRAAGVSLMDVSKAVLQVSIIVALLVSIVGETLVPKLRLWADNYKTLKTSNGNVLSTQHGMWIRERGDFINIDLIASPKLLYGITRYKLDKQGKLQQTSHAESAVYEEGQWQLINLETTDISTQGIKTAVTSKHLWKVTLAPEILSVAVIEPMQMNLLELYLYQRYRQKTHLASGEYAYAFWQRIFQPFSTAVMILLAIPFISGSLRSSTMGLKLLLGIVVGFLFYILNQLFGPMSSVYQLPPILAAMLPMLIFGLLSVVLLKKIR